MKKVYDRIIIYCFIINNICKCETVVLKSNDYDKPLDSCYEYHDVLVKSNDGILFWWTGTEFIKCSLLDTKFTKSDDLVEWSDIDISYDVRMCRGGLHRANIKHYGINILYIMKYISTLL